MVQSPSPAPAPAPLQDLASAAKPYGSLEGGDLHDDTEWGCRPSRLASVAWRFEGERHPGKRDILCSNKSRSARRQGGVRSAISDSEIAETGACGAPT